MAVYACARDVMYVPRHMAAKNAGGEVSARLATPTPPRLIGGLNMSLV